MGGVFESIITLPNNSIITLSMPEDWFWPLPKSIASDWVILNLLKNQPDKKYKIVHQAPFRYRLIESISFDDDSWPEKIAFLIFRDFGHSESLTNEVIYDEVE